ncbi:cation diffusion facilitator family transporter [Rhodopila globiformis]|uniref:Cobalt transporter n=1 Tax=Rhodopila globiformis TaxID=1071 RepID=A0A2S6N380_RHOGL|nr:cation transporter [Rhodopila globiformis]PPQ29056.1 cobalt transporter [Rhodopila globiformis]
MDTNLSGQSSSGTTQPESSCHDACCTGVPAHGAANNPDRAALIRRAFMLEYTTVGWMLVEAAVAIWAGVHAASVSLLAFGIDSVIELASAGILIWRLTVELRRGQAFAESAERVASRIAGGLLFALAAYVVIAAGWKLRTQTGATFSWPGLVVTLLAMPVMYVLARQKITVADALGSRAMRADAMESVTCGWLSLMVVVGLVAQGLTGAWWVDSVTSLGIVWFLVKEGREAWRGEDCCCD